MPKPMPVWMRRKMHGKDETPTDDMMTGPAPSAEDASDSGQAPDTMTSPEMTIDCSTCEHTGLESVQDGDNVVVTVHGKASVQGGSVTVVADTCDTSRDSAGDMQAGFDEANKE